MNTQEMIKLLDEAVEWLQELHDDGDAADWALDKHAEMANNLRQIAAKLRNAP